MRKFLVLINTALFLSFSIKAQWGDSSFAEKVRKLSREEIITSTQKYRDGKIAERQELLIKDLRQTSERATIYLKKGNDTAGYFSQLRASREQLDVAMRGISAARDSIQTARNLAVSSVILRELLTRITERSSRLSVNAHTVSDFIDRIDSLSADTALYSFPTDSLQFVRYLRKVQLLARELGPADTALRRTLMSLQQVQTDFSLLQYDIRASLEIVEQLKREQTARALRKDYGFAGDSKTYFALPEIFHISFAKEKLALGYYATDHSGKMVVVLLLILASWYFIRTLKHKWTEEKSIDPGWHRQLVFRYPLASALLIVISVFQFLFIQPPFVFSMMLWLVTAISLTIIIRGYVSRFWMRFWLIALLLFLVAGSMNLLLLPSAIERWGMLLLSTAGSAYGVYVLRSSRKTELREKALLYFVNFLVIFELLSTILNLAGRYNMAKSLFVSGFVGMVVALCFLWTVRLINEGLGLVSEIYRHPDRKLFYIDFDRVGEKAPTLLYVFLVLGWFVMVGRNFSAFEQSIVSIRDFLDTERTVGNYTFTINSLFIFLMIIGVSSILSQIISFFAGEPGDQRVKDKHARQPGLGSWLLLIRIFILSLGLFFAFAAAGIPLDKLAIVIGALGVGIGLGLQGLVSNLVSGLIIAFEKPVNVGDIVEVNGKLGTMKSIGFRSSVMTLVDGACLVIPNSDLLSNHVVNWTMANNRRRINLAVSVAYGSDLARVKEVIETVLRENQRVMKHPEPVVSAKAFQDSSIGIDVYFWVNHVREYLGLRGEVLMQVHEAFRKEGIEIPFPQQDLHIIPVKEKEAGTGNGQ